MPLKVIWDAALERDLGVASYSVTVIGVKDYALTESAAGRILRFNREPSDWVADERIIDMKTSRAPVITAKRWSYDDGGGVRLRLSGFFSVEDAQIAANRVLADACDCGEGREERGTTSMLAPPDPGCSCDEGEESKARAVVKAAELVASGRGL